jgi:hypothetical protein
VAVSAQAPPPDVRDLALRVAELERKHDALKRDPGHFSLRLARWVLQLEVAIRRRAA